eukprot:5401020-Karenia_brevis.AAC.1
MVHQGQSSSLLISAVWKSEAMHDISACQMGQKCGGPCFFFTWHLCNGGKHYSQQRASSMQGGSIGIQRYC